MPYKYADKKFNKIMIFLKPVNEVPIETFSLQMITNITTSIESEVINF